MEDDLRKVVLGATVGAVLGALVGLLVARLGPTRQSGDGSTLPVQAKTLDSGRLFKLALNVLGIVRQVTEL